jgi:hypothetical protein
MTESPVLELTVDYNRTIQQVVAAAGIGWRVQARLGVFGNGRHELTAERLRFDEDVATPRVLARMAELDLRPATLFELASAAEDDDSIGRRAVLVALGSCDVNFVGGSACPAIHTIGGKRQITMTGFFEAWPARTEFLAIPKALPAGHGNVAHNHLLPIEAKRTPKLVFGQPPTSTTHRVPFNGSFALRAVAKKAKLRNLSDNVDDESLFPPPPRVETALDMTVVQFNRQLRTRDIAEELAARGMRPVTIHELVALLAAEPTLIDTRSIWSIAGTCAGVFKAGARTLGVNVRRGSDDHWPFGASFAGVAV